jgi:hypothetical protein
MKSDSKEALALLQRVRKYSRKQALEFMRGLTSEGLNSLCIDLRRSELESRGQGVLALSRLPEPFVVPKKVPYSLLIPPMMLDALRVRSARDGDSVSHHIRAAIKAYLGKSL